MPELFSSFPSFLFKKHSVDFSTPIEPYSFEKKTLKLDLLAQRRVVRTAPIIKSCCAFRPGHNLKPGDLNSWPPGSIVRVVFTELSLNSNMPDTVSIRVLHCHSFKNEIFFQSFSKGHCPPIWGTFFFFFFFLQILPVAIFEKENNLRF